MGGGVPSSVVLAAALLAVVCPCALAIPLQFFGAGATWSYWDNNTAPASGWQNSSFDDSSWRKGIAPIHYGNTGNGTVMQRPAVPTTYFRKTVSLAAVSEFTWYLVGRLDDGAVVYLNGVEVWRFNVAAAGALGPESTATSLITGLAEGTDQGPQQVPATLFLEGDNLLAVELHQVAGDSDADASMSLALQVCAAGNMTLMPCAAVTADLAGHGTLRAASPVQRMQQGGVVWCARHCHLPLSSCSC
jgi:hypothetical protein